MSILRSPLVYAKPLTGLAEGPPLHLRRGISQALSLPAADQHEPGSSDVVDGRLVQGNNSGGVLRRYESDYSGYEQIIVNPPWPFNGPYRIDFAQPVKFVVMYLWSIGPGNAVHWCSDTGTVLASYDAFGNYKMPVYGSGFWYKVTGPWPGTGFILWGYY